ncbi:DNA starvation/stationary phase protection protein [Parvularcula sp. LCG005]|uniref:Dps family protein n=1 Tax=Parvularcula sp. LCG005 TaxID=3078805 RepID=UPI002942B024|nr:DNA starvation/stationary phase protection protein [Parvularcula sp. LCG005]WOI53065.1 DNA starvation/stationary phase protection protein [Parvularcula sp. LCG005]
MSASMKQDIPVKVGIDQKDRKKLAQKMGAVLSSTYVLYHKTHAFHWNITGPMFYSVHKLTDDQYLALAEAIDEIAERVRAIGFPTPVGLGNYIKDSVVDDVAALPEPEAMIKQLAEDHQSISRQLHEAVEEAEELNDVFTADLLTARIGAHEEASWMLSALIAK